MEAYVNYSVEQAVRLLAIDSPSGYTHNAAAYVIEECKKLGITAELTRKGGVIFCINPEAAEEDAQ
jgi:putative aminopeptidase FrvX